LQQILYKDIKDLEIIGDGGFGVVYKAKHARFGTVVYKELDAKKLGDRCVKIILHYVSKKLIFSFVITRSNDD